MGHVRVKHDHKCSVPFLLLSVLNIDVFTERHALLVTRMSLRTPAGRKADSGCVDFM